MTQAHHDPVAKTPKLTARLPKYATSFVGRHQELERAQLLLRSCHVLIWGPAGVGKSRFAAEIAHRHALAYPDALVGVADLTYVSSEAEAFEQLALALELPLPSSPDEAAAQLLRALSHGQGLLILEHLEHVPPSTLNALMVRLGSARPGALMATSRRGELEGFEPIALGPLEAKEALALFDVRVKERGLDLALASMQEGAAFNALIDAVDGLPLAIELLIGRLNLMSPEALLERLPRSRSLDPLHDALEFSWQLLSKQAQAALGAMSVMREPAPLPWLEQLLPESSTEPWSLLDELTRSSWVQRLATQPPRLYLLHSMSRFVAHKSAPALLAQARDRHAELFAGLAKQWLDGIETSAELECNEALIQACPDLLAAHEHMPSSTQRAQLGLSLARALERSAQRERLLRLAEQIYQDAQGDPTLEASALMLCARVARDERDLDRAQAMLDQCSALAPKLDGPTLCALLRAQTTLTQRRGDAPLLKLQLQQMLELAQERGTTLDKISAFSSMSFMLRDSDELDRAQALLDRALTLAQDPALPFGIKGMLSRTMAALLERRHQFEQAKAHCVRAIDTFRGRSWHQHVALELLTLAELELALGSPDEARAHVDESITLSLRLGHAKIESRARYLEALLSFVADDLSTSLEALRQARALLGSSAERGFLARIDLQAARAYISLGDLAAASAAFERVVIEPTGALEDNMALTRAMLFGEPMPARDKLREASLVAIWDKLTAAARAERLVLRVEPQGHSFIAPDGEPQRLSRRRALRCILWALVRAHQDHPGQGLSLEQLQEAGWPGERMTYESGKQRVYVTLNRLRNLGLDPFVCTTGDGYMLLAQVELEVEPL